MDSPSEFARMTVLITAPWLVSCCPTEQAPEAVLKCQDAGLLIGPEGRIEAVGPRAQLLDDLRRAGRNYREESFEQHILIPGLVNAHTHAAMCLLRGAGDDLPLTSWLKDCIWPLEAELVDADFVRLGTTLAAAEMLLGGTTCCADMYWFPDAAASAYVALGLRAQLAMPVIDFPTRYAPDAEACLVANLQARDRWRAEPLLSWALGPHAPYTVSDASYERVLAYAAELDLPIHTHLQETAQETRDSLEHYGLSPTARLARLGITAAGLVGAHGVHLSTEDRQTLAASGASIVHCPSSNLKLASGLADLPALLAAGVNLALGTDGAASNNRLDLFEEMRLAALLGKLAARDASALPAKAAFTMATLGGARALGLDSLCGSLEVGKQADLVAVRVQGPAATPMFDPVSHLVYVASRSDVEAVWVGGRQRVAQGALVRDAEAALAECLPGITAISAHVASRSLQSFP